MKLRMRRVRGPLALLLICLSTPLAMGGCANLQTQIIGQFETAFVGYIGELISAFFDQLPRDSSTGP